MLLLKMPNKNLIVHSKITTTERGGGSVSILTNESDSIQNWNELLKEEREIYSSNVGLEVEEYDITTITDIFRKKFGRHIKFLADADMDYKNPSVLQSTMNTDNSKKSQTIKIIEVLTENSGRKNYGWREKCKFWISFRGIVKKQVAKHRRYYVDETKRRLIQGEKKFCC